MLLECELVMKTHTNSKHHTCPPSFRPDALIPISLATARPVPWFEMGYMATSHMTYEFGFVTIGPCCWHGVSRSLQSDGKISPPLHMHHSVGISTLSVGFAMTDDRCDSSTICSCSIRRPDAAWALPLERSHSGGAT